MTERQTELFEAPYQRHSDSSREAAQLAEATGPSIRAAIMRLLLERGEHGATDEEIQDALEINPSTERPRRIELWRAMNVLDSGQTRLTRSSRRAVVWIAAKWGIGV